jgi:hypothetical protein
MEINIITSNQNWTYKFIDFYQIFIDWTIFMHFLVNSVSLRLSKSSSTSGFFALLIPPPPANYHLITITHWEHRIDYTAEGSRDCEGLDAHQYKGKKYQNQEDKIDKCEIHNLLCHSETL